MAMTLAVDTQRKDVLLNGLQRIDAVLEEMAQVATEKDKGRCVDLCKHFNFYDGATLLDFTDN